MIHFDLTKIIKGRRTSGWTWPQTFLLTTNMSRFLLSFCESFNSLHGSTVP